MMIVEGALPFIWLPIWWLCIRDHPSQAKWISDEERNYLENTLAKERDQLSSPGNSGSVLAILRQGPVMFTVAVMLLLYFLHNSAAYGCMTFFTSGLKGQGFSPIEYGVLLALPYALTAVIMVLNSWHSDKTHERRGHVAIVYLMSGVSLILSVALRQHFWVSYFFLCFAIPGPFAAMAPFWSIPSETMPRILMAVVIGLVNAFGNLGGYMGQYLVGWLAKKSGSTGLPFDVLGVGMLVCAGLAFLLPKPGHIFRLSPVIAEAQPAAK